MVARELVAGYCGFGFGLFGVRWRATVAIRVAVAITVGRGYLYRFYSCAGNGHLNLLDCADLDDCFGGLL
jgi:hypothetical protein